MIEKVLLVESVGNKKIQRAIVIIIAPHTPKRISSVIHDCAGGDFCKRVVRRTVVEIEKIIAPIVSDKEIEIAIVIAITPCTADRIAAVICYDASCNGSKSI